MTVASMTINDILKKCIDLDVVNDRVRKEDYAELVFSTKDTDKWVTVLEECMGKMAKPPQTKTSKEHERITKDFGGINDGQTLFLKPVDDYYIIAMFWPWGNGEQTTLKLAKANPPKKGFLDGLFSK